MLRFCILGSAVGGGAFVVVRGLLHSTQSPEIGKAALAFVLGVPFYGTLASFMSIPLGLVPAGGACLAYWFILKRFTATNPGAVVRTVLGATSGGAAAFTFGSTLFSAGTGPGGYSVAVNAWSWLIAGLVGGAASALSARRATYEATFATRSAASGA